MTTKATALLAGAAGVITAAWFLASAQRQPAGDGPRFTADGQLMRPENYREWVYLSSGLGMTYGSPAGAAEASPRFDNVFVNPAAYRAFLRTGAWPDQTILVLEVRSSESKASINKGGRFQTGLLSIEVNVKDTSRFPGKWAFFAFPGSATTSRQIPTTAACYSCHAQNGAVDNTFVQFYPTLLAVAQQKGTLNARAAAEAGALTAAVTDVVCGMSLNPSAAYSKKEYGGKIYHFCSKDCRDRFEAAPARYTKSAP